MGDSTFSARNSLIGQYLFLSDAGADDSASIEFSNFDQSNIMTYRFIFVNVVPATDGATWRMRTSSDGGSSYDSGASDYKWASTNVDNSGTTTATDSTGDSFIDLSSAVGSASNEGISGYVDLFSPNRDDLVTQSISKFAIVDTAGNLEFNVGAGSRNESNVVNGVQFYFSSGNITSGFFLLYGVKTT